MALRRAAIFKTLKETPDMPAEERARRLQSLKKTLASCGENTELLAELAFPETMLCHLASLYTSWFFEKPAYV